MKKVIKLSVVFMAIIIFCCSLAGCGKGAMIEPGAASIDDLTHTLSYNGLLSENCVEFMSNSMLCGLSGYGQYSDVLSGDPDKIESTLRYALDEDDYYTLSNATIHIDYTYEVSADNFYNDQYDYIDSSDSTLKELIDSERSACSVVYVAEGYIALDGETQSFDADDEYIFIIEANGRYYFYIDM